MGVVLRVGGWGGGGYLGREVILPRGQQLQQQHPACVLQQVCTGCLPLRTADCRHTTPHQKLATPAAANSPFFPHLARLQSLVSAEVSTTQRKCTLQHLA